MSDAPEKEESALRSLLWGAAIPFGIVFVCAAICVIWKLVAGLPEIDVWELGAAAVMGAAIGCLLAVVGVLDMMAGMLFSGSRIVNGVLGAVGYLIGWAALIVIVLSIWGLSG